jgi:sporulation protein YlmC with PRC-barrel domain
MRYLPAAAAAVVLLGTTMAVAQQAEVWKEADNDALVVQPLNLPVSEVEDMDIVGPDGSEVGEVEEVLVNAAGQAAAVAAEVGGFLGVGEKEVIIPLNQLQVSGDDLATAMTKEQLEALPEWAY